MTTAAVAVRMPLAALVGLEVVAVGVLAAAPPAQWTWWPAAVLVVAVAAAGAVRVKGHNVFGWARIAVRERRAARAHPVTVGAAVDIPIASGVCGVRCDGPETLTAIALYGHPYSVTLLRGSGIALSNNRIELDTLSGFLDAPGGLRLRVDMVNAGHRVRRAGGYAQLYSTMLADRSAADIVSYLFLRMDVAESVSGLEYRASLGSAVAAATERAVSALNHRGIRASAVNATDLDALLAGWSAGLAVPPPQPAEAEEDSDGDGGEADPEQSARGSRRRRGGPPQDLGMTSRRAAAERTRLRWRHVQTKRGFLTTYYLTPREISTASINQAWALRTDAVVQTISLWRSHVAGAGAVGPVTVAATVQTCDPQPPQHPPLLNLNTLPGQQYAGLLRAAPMRRPAVDLESAPLAALRSQPVSVSIGSTGILVGTALYDDPTAAPPVRCDDLVMLALTDPVRATRIHMAVSDLYVRQLLLRAAAVGERIAIHTDRPRHWQGLAQVNIAVVSGPRSRASFVPSIVVDDALAVAPNPGLASTVISLDAGDAADADITFTSMPHTDAVRIGVGGMHIDVGIVEFRQEQAWLGLGA